MKHLIYRFLSLLILLFYTNYIFAATECEKKLMNAYLVHRSALLQTDFTSKSVLETLVPNFQNNFDGDIKHYLVALRIREAKIIKLYDYAAKCESEGGTVKIKILYLDGEYERLYISIKKYGGKYFLYSSSAEVASEEFDKDEKYEPVVLKDLAAITLK